MTSTPVTDSAQGTRPGSAIIVRFFARDKQNQMLINKNTLKDNVDFKNVFISEDITQLWANLLHYVNPEEHVVSAYTLNGKIICQIRDNSRIVLESPDKLFKNSYRCRFSYPWT